MHLLDDKDEATAAVKVTKAQHSNRKQIKWDFDILTQLIIHQKFTELEDQQKVLHCMFVCLS